MRRPLSESKDLLCQQEYPVYLETRRVSCFDVVWVNQAFCPACFPYLRSECTQYVIRFAGSRIVRLLIIIFSFNAKIIFLVSGFSFQFFFFYFVSRNFQNVFVVLRFFIAKKDRNFFFLIIFMWVNIFWEILINCGGKFFLKFFFVEKQFQLRQH